MPTIRSLCFKTQETEGKAVLKCIYNLQRDVHGTEEMRKKEHTHIEKQEGQNNIENNKFLKEKLLP